MFTALLLPFALGRVTDSLNAPPKGSCLDAADQKLLRDENLQTIVNCDMKCDDDEGCVAKCFEGDGYTTGCATCFGDLSQCGKTSASGKCADQCLNGKEATKECG